MSCPCDKRIHPPRRIIQTGLEKIPRQIAGFPEFRRAMLAALPSKPVLKNWRVRNGDDLGMMLLEMWAYVCDVLGFYDETIAHECYLRTARLRPSLRKLVGLLSYLPRPAVGSKVSLAVFAEGRQPVMLPAGTAFRSSAFDGNPPQVFETDSETTIHPWANKWSIEPPPKETIGSTPPWKFLPKRGTALRDILSRLHLNISTSDFLLKPGSVKAKEGDVVLLHRQNELAETAQVRRIERMETTIGTDGQRYVRISLNEDVVFASNTPIKEIRLLTPTRTAYHWKGEEFPHPLEENQVRLDGVYREIRVGHTIILEKEGEYRWFQVGGSEETKSSVKGGIIEDWQGLEMPSIIGPVSHLTLDTSRNDPSRSSLSEEEWNEWTESDLKQASVLYDLADGGEVTMEAKNVLSHMDQIKLVPALETPRDGAALNRFFLVDKDQLGIRVEGNIKTGQLELEQDMQWESGLRLPGEVFGNVVDASQGETVKQEVLGSGDASIPNQSFKLKKKPLTYLSAPTAENDSGVASTLEIYVGGIRWTEVPTFFRVREDAPVYIVRQDDEGNSTVSFGDGHSGSRLPTGRGNVIANYRYGAGAASPPAGTITQLAKPVKGIKSVRQPVSAYGGDDAESSEGLRTYGPGSALILGRAVSIKDMESIALGFPGVRDVSVQWDWHETKQRPVAQIWYVGKSGIEASLEKRLKSVSEPTTSIDVLQARGVQVELSLSIEIDPRHLPSVVLSEVRAALMNRDTGLLSPERVGIGRPLYRSRIFEAVLSVPGAISVAGIFWNGQPFEAFAMDPGKGNYFDLENGELVISQKEEISGRKAPR